MEVEGGINKDEKIEMKVKEEHREAGRRRQPGAPAASVSLSRKQSPLLTRDERKSFGESILTEHKIYFS